MCTMVAPASLARRTSFAYSSGVYGMPAHCCLFATAPETAQVMMQGSSPLTSLSGRHPSAAGYDPVDGGRTGALRPDREGPGRESRRGGGQGLRDAGAEAGAE